MGPVKSPERPQRPASDPDYFELSGEEWAAAAKKALGELGLTYAQLKQQAEHREFSSRDAHLLWVAIGGTVDL